MRDLSFMTLSIGCELTGKVFSMLRPCLRSSVLWNNQDTYEHSHPFWHPLKLQCAVAQGRGPTQSAADAADRGAVFSKV